jgi:hypothetical protein
MDGEAIVPLYGRSIFVTGDATIPSTVIILMSRQPIERSLDR